MDLEKCHTLSPTRGNPKELLYPHHSTNWNHFVGSMASLTIFSESTSEVNGLSHQSSDIRFRIWMLRHVWKNPDMTETISWAYPYWLSPYCIKNLWFNEVHTIPTRDFSGSFTHLHTTESSHIFRNPALQAPKDRQIWLRERDCFGHDFGSEVWVKKHPYQIICAFLFQ